MDFTTWKTNTNTHIQLNKAEIKSSLAGIYIVMREKKEGGSQSTIIIYIFCMASSASGQYAANSVF